jgi:hypothetical protein
MKTIISLCTVFLISIVGYTQGSNLQFAETKILKMEGSLFYDGVIYSQTITIPEGQTWKIESATANVQTTTTSDTSYTYNTSLRILLDNFIIWKYDDNNHYNFPMWLPAGTYEITLWSEGAFGTNEYKAHGCITALVFNIAP